MPEIYYLTEKKEYHHDAGSKAPNDIEELCRRRGYLKFETGRFPEGKNRIYRKLWMLIKGNFYWFSLYKRVKEGDIIFVQHPSHIERIANYWIKRIKRGKKCKFISLIHDLGSIRGWSFKNKRVADYYDSVVLKSYDALICHNDKMIAYLCDKGFEKEKLVDLQIFDYLTSFDNCLVHRFRSNSVVIAGNMNPEKSSYIYRMVDEKHNTSLQINLFGSNVSEKDLHGNMTWFGSFDPDVLISKLDGSFGLIWDGPSAETCDMEIGNYLRYINPHKLSLYLVSGLPVIIWEKAAMSGFILKNKLGITLNSLYELEDRISSITDEEYREMKENAGMISEKIKNGYFFYRAFDEAVNRIVNGH